MVFQYVCGLWPWRFHNNGLGIIEIRRWYLLGILETADLLITLGLSWDGGGFGE